MTSMESLERRMRCWINSLPIPSCLLVSDLGELTTGAVFVDIVESVTGERLGAGRDHTARLRAALRAVAGREGKEAMPAMLLAPEAADRMAEGDRQALHTFIAVLKRMYERLGPASSPPAKAVRRPPPSYASSPVSVPSSSPPAYSDSLPPSVSALAEHDAESEAVLGSWSTADAVRASWRSDRDSVREWGAQVEQSAAESLAARIDAARRFTAALPDALRPRSPTYGALGALSPAHQSPLRSEEPQAQPRPRPRAKSRPQKAQRRSKQQPRPQQQQPQQQPPRRSQPRRSQAQAQPRPQSTRRMVDPAATFEPGRTLRRPASPVPSTPAPSSNTPQQGVATPQTPSNGSRLGCAEIVRALRGLGVSLRNVEAGDGRALATAFSDGVLLCEVVAALDRREGTAQSKDRQKRGRGADGRQRWVLQGTTLQPKSGAQALHNIAAALQVLQQNQRMNVRHLSSAEALRSADPTALLELLSDALDAYGGAKKPKRRPQPQPQKQPGSAPMPTTPSRSERTGRAPAAAPAPAQAPTPTPTPTSSETPGKGKGKGKGNGNGKREDPPVERAERSKRRGASGKMSLREGEALAPRSNSAYQRPLTGPQTQDFLFPAVTVEQRTSVRSWLHRLGFNILFEQVKAGHFLDDPLRNGVLLCELVKLLEPNCRIATMHRKPTVIAQTRENTSKALAELRRFRHPPIPQPYLWEGEAIIKGDDRVMWGLLWHVMQAYPPIQGPPDGKWHLSTYHLPYTANQKRQLEKSLLSWLHSLGVVRSGRTGGVPYDMAELQESVVNGTLLCDLAARLSGRPIPGVFRKPRTPAVALNNIRKALAVLRRLPRMGQRFLWAEERIQAGDRVAVLGLLEDTHRAHAGKTARPVRQGEAEQPFFGQHRPRETESPEPPMRTPLLAPDWIGGQESTHGIAPGPGNVGSGVLRSAGHAVALDSARNWPEDQPLVPTTPARQAGLAASSIGASSSSMSNAYPGLGGADIVPLPLSRPAELRPGVPTPSRARSSLPEYNPTADVLTSTASNDIIPVLLPPPPPPSVMPSIAVLERAASPARALGPVQLEDNGPPMDVEAVVEWLRSLGINLSRPDQLRQEVATEWTDGVLLCRLVELLDHSRGGLRGVNPQPKSKATCLMNIRKALEALREKNSMPLEHLHSDARIQRGETRVIVPLLLQMRKAFAGFLPTSYFRQG